MVFHIGNLLPMKDLLWPTIQDATISGIEVFQFFFFLFQDVNACYNIESIYVSLRDTGRRPPVFGPPAVDEER
jgi:hypothetical protein